MLHAKYGLEMYSNAIITQRDRVQKNPDQCRALVDGAMEGLKFSFLDPDKTTDIHLDTVKEYEGASNDRAFVKYGVLINTATALAPYLEQNRSRPHGAAAGRGHPGQDRRSISA